MADPKLLKAAIKEGGKKGIEIAGAADLGGLEFFCTTVETPDGDMDLLIEVMNAMNKEIDQNEEEQKGGAGHVGKMVFSAGTEKLVCLAVVPEDKQAKINAKEWMEAVVAAVPGLAIVGDANAGKAAGQVAKSEDRFPIKMKDEALAAAFAYLRSKNAIPDREDDDDDVSWMNDSGLEW
eukprot:jgi/Mesvir1/22549/Mv18564-RA.1